jgi:hypothetical protein
MPLTELKWTKNVKKIYIKNKVDSKWAYDEYKREDEFKLHWRNQNNRDEKNANKPNKGENIILRQHGAITHIVQLLDEKPQNENTGGEFNIYRYVKVIWVMEDWENPLNTDKFFKPKIYFPPNGQVHEIKRLKAFKERWAERELAEFQQCIQQELKI